MLILLIGSPWLLPIAGCGSAESSDAGGPEPGSQDASIRPDAATEAGLEAGGGPSADAGADPTLTRIETGLLRGTEGSENTIAFLGVPFAAPPVGDRRFRAPTAPEPWEGIRNADAFGPPCLQWDRGTGEPRGSEDCLYLNVWRPRDESSQPRAVLVFIHGGGNVTGSAVDAREGVMTYAGAGLAGRGDVIVVTIQYRLNVFGYLMDAALDGSAPSGNYGPRDQVAALEWVRDNISAFGGDPQSVLLFGESAGGTNTCALLATPSAEGLFHRAVVMSGGCGGRTQQEVRAWTDAIARSVGCTDPATRAPCLRQVDGETLVEAAFRPATAAGVVTTPAAPTVDGSFLPESPLAALVAGRHAAMPIMMGVTAEETSSPLFGIPFGLTAAEYEERVRAAFPEVADRVLEAYPVDAFDTPRDALVAVTTDAQFLCPSRFAVEATAQSQQVPVHHYVFTHTYEGESTGPFGPEIFGAAHGFELPFLFQRMGLYEGYRPTAREIELQAILADYWTTFARAGEPSARAGPDWPAVTPDGLVSMDLNPTPEPVVDYREARCEFWAALVGQW